MGAAAAPSAPPADHERQSKRQAEQAREVMGADENRVEIERERERHHRIERAWQIRDNQCLPPARR